MAFNTVSNKNKVLPYEHAKGEYKLWKGFGNLFICKTSSNVYQVVWLFLNLYIRTNVSIFPQIFV